MKNKPACVCIPTSTTVMIVLTDRLSHRNDIFCRSTICPLVLRPWPLLGLLEWDQGTPPTHEHRTGADDSLYGVEMPLEKDVSLKVPLRRQES